MFDAALLLVADEKDSGFPAEHSAGFPEPRKTHITAGADAERPLIEAVGRALRATGHPPLRMIEIEVSRAIVVLRGQVPTYYLKQLAQSTAQKVEGVRGVTNGIEVICFR